MEGWSEREIKRWAVCHFAAIKEHLNMTGHNYLSCSVVHHRCVLCNDATRGFFKRGNAAASGLCTAATAKGSA